MPTVTQDQLADFLAKVSTLEEVEFDYVKDADMYVKENPYRDKVLKISRIKAIINKDYQDKVNEERVAQGTGDDNYTAGKRIWGVPRHGCPLVDHKGEVYVSFLDVKYLDVSYRHKASGELISKSTLSPFLKPGREDKSSDNQGLLEAVVPHTLKIRQIPRMTILGFEFEVLPNV